MRLIANNGIYKEAKTMEKKMLKQSLAVWMILILLFVSFTPVALMEDDAAIVPVAEETAGDETVINEENDQLLDESAELVDNVTGEATPVAEEPVVEEPVVEEPVVEEPVVEEPVVEEPAVEEEYTLYMVEEDTDLRMEADGLSEILATIPAETEIKAYVFTENWIKVSYTDPVLGEVEGYIYRDLEDTSVMSVVIFSSRRSVVMPGETIYLTSKISGFDNYEVSYQWQCDKGNGFEDVSGATSDSYSFAASVETLSYDWRLAIYYH